MKMKFLLIMVLLFVGRTGWGQDYFMEIPYENERGKMIVTATVEGVEGRYIFDTGAPTTITYTRFAQCYGKNINQKQITDAHGQKSMYNETYMESILFGGGNYQNVGVLILDKGNAIECFDVDGIIGANLFPFSIVRIDSRRKMILVTNDASSFSLSPRNQLKMIPNKQNLTFFEIYLGGGVTDRVMFDTGSPAFYELKETIYDQVKGQNCIQTLSTGFGALAMGVSGAEKTSVKYRVKVPQMKIGMGKFQDVVTVTMNGPSSRVGTKLLDYGVVTIDYPNHCFYFEPFDAGAINMFRKDWNVNVTVSGDRLVAGCVWESMKDQLSGGEKVVEINGKRFDKVDMCEVLTTSVAKLEGEESTIVVIDGEGKEKKIVIRKE